MDLKLIELSSLHLFRHPQPQESLSIGMKNDNDCCSYVRDLAGFHPISEFSTSISCYLFIDFEVNDLHQLLKDIQHLYYYEMNH